MLISWKTAHLQVEYCTVYLNQTITPPPVFKEVLRRIFKRSGDFAQPMIHSPRHTSLDLGANAPMLVATGICFEWLYPMEAGTFKPLLWTILSHALLFFYIKIMCGYYIFDVNPSMLPYRGVYIFLDIATWVISACLLKFTPRGYLSITKWCWNNSDSLVRWFSITFLLGYISKMSFLNWQSIKNSRELKGEELWSRPFPQDLLGMPVTLAIGMAIAAVLFLMPEHYRKKVESRLDSRLDLRSRFELKKLTKLIIWCICIINTG